MAKRSASSPPRAGFISTLKDIAARVSALFDGAAKAPPKVAGTARPPVKVPNVKTPVDPTKPNVPVKTPKVVGNAAVSVANKSKKGGVAFVTAFAHGIAARSHTMVDVHVYKFGRYEDKKRGWKGFKATTVTIDGASRPRKHKCFILSKSYEPGRKFVASPSIFASCDCEDWCWNGWEYAFAVRGAADIIYGDGSAPTTRNPSLRPAFCKHLLQLGFEIKRRRLVG
jgi:hypothetical protein